MPTVSLTLGALATWTTTLFSPYWVESTGWPRAPTDCQDEGPVLTTVIQAESGQSSGEWRIPLSVSRPEILTEARLRVDWVDVGSSALKIKVHFPDPKPYGLPFTFQALAVEASGSAGSDVTRTTLDWTQDCSGPGRSLFPGGSWEEVLELNPSESAVNSLRILLWGSRN